MQPVNLKKIFGRKAIVPSLKAKDKRGVIVELAAALKKAYPDEKLQAAEIVDAIMDREAKVGSTGIHGGVAIPHARIDALKELRGAFGRAVHPVDFKAVDGEPSHLFFLLVAPPAMNDSYLEALRKISTAIKASHFCKFLKAAKSVKDIEVILGEAEEAAQV